MIIHKNCFCVQVTAYVIVTAKSKRLRLLLFCRKWISIFFINVLFLFYLLEV